MSIKTRGFTTLQMMFLLIVIALISAYSFQINLNSIEKSKIKQPYRDDSNLTPEEEEAIGILNLTVNKDEKLLNDIKINNQSYPLINGYNLHYSITISKFIVSNNFNNRKEIVINEVNKNGHIYLVPEI